MIRTLMLLALMPLAGCGEFLTEGTADVAGIAGAGVAGAVTKDATVGAAIGLGVRSVANLGLHFAERRVHRAEQDRIAAVAGALPEGAAAPWDVVHDVPIERDERGTVTVTRIIAARLDPARDFTCKEIIFSVDRGTGPGLSRGFFTATVCLDGTAWKWASAEPATERWGSLQ